jgi:hypothetical protein
VEGEPVSARTLTLAGFVVLLAAGIAWSAYVARRPGLISLHGLVERITAHRLVRIAFAIGWAWLGWHLFARGSGAFE